MSVSIRENVVIVSCDSCDRMWRFAAGRWLADDCRAAIAIDRANGEILEGERVTVVCPDCFQTHKTIPYLPRRGTDA